MGRQAIQCSSQRYPRNAAPVGLDGCGSPSRTLHQREDGNKPARPLIIWTRSHVRGALARVWTSRRALKPHDSAPCDDLFVVQPNGSLPVALTGGRAVEEARDQTDERRCRYLFWTRWFAGPRFLFLSASLAAGFDSPAFSPPGKSEHTEAR